MKYCKYCGEQIHEDAIICPKCGRQIEELKGSASNQAQPNIIVNNTATANATMVGGNPKDKTTAIILCCLGFLGFAGIHKFYEGKIFMGILYFFTGGLLFIGTIIDLIALLGKPKTYYV